jgi:hypothetical protein
MRLSARLLSAAAPTILAASTLAAHADTFQYVVDDNGISATFDEASILTTGTTIQSSAFVSIDNPYLSFGEADPTSIFINPTSASGCGVASKKVNACVVTYYASEGEIDVNEYTVGPFTSVGSYIEPFDTSVTITEIPDAPSVPEPSSFALFGTGILGMAGLARRKFVQQ